MGRFLFLRGGEDGARLADALSERGQQAAILALQEIVPLAEPLPAGPFGGVLATSAHAGPWLAEHRELHALPALGVGPRTGRALGRAGFRDVREGSGEALLLVPPAEAIAHGSGLPILYAAGRVRRPETEMALRAALVPFRTVEVYDARLRTPEPAELIALASSELSGVLLLSAAQAASFASFSEQLGPLRILCLSARIRQSLPARLRTGAEVAEAPTLAALAERAAAGQEARGSA